ncbi:MAG: DUF1294 domain-containing protein [Clostridiales bacterium]|nr:DUF1294 domain-containing protein [Clostridiales bacterium]
MNIAFILKAVGLYLLLINIATFSLFAIDKWKAIHGRWRIRESVLLGCSLIGGAALGLLSMHLFHHKTQKKYFSIGLPIMLAVHLVICGVVLYKLI